MTERFDRFARALESYVPWVADSKPDTGEQLRERLLAILQCLSDGCLHCLPSVDESPAVRRRRLSLSV